METTEKSKLPDERALIFRGKPPIVLNRKHGDYIAYERLGQLNNGERLVETAGYMDKTTQLANLLSSGERLQNYLKRIYPSKDEIDNIEITDDMMKRELEIYPDLIDVEDRILQIRIKNRARQEEATRQRQEELQRLVKHYNDTVTNPVGKIDTIDASDGASVQ